MDSDKPKQQKFKCYPISHFHIDIAEVRSVEEQIHLFVAVGRTLELAAAQSVE